MAYFCFHAFDKPDVLDTRLALRDAHRAYLRNHDHPVTVRIGGPLLDAEGNMHGSMLVIEATNRADVEAFLAGDEYMKAGIFASHTIEHFNWGLGQPVDSNG